MLNKLIININKCSLPAIDEECSWNGQPETAYKTSTKEVLDHRKVLSSQVAGVLSLLLVVPKSGNRNPVNSPLEVGSSSHYFRRIFYIPGGFLAGFLNHQQYPSNCRRKHLIQQHWVPKPALCGNDCLVKLSQLTATARDQSTEGSFESYQGS